jgi:hypothetical protein
VTSCRARSDSGMTHDGFMRYDATSAPAIEATGLVKRPSMRPNEQRIIGTAARTHGSGEARYRSNTAKARSGSRSPRPVPHLKRAK